MNVINMPGIHMVRADFLEKFFVRVDVTEEFPVPGHQDVAVL
jgi:hypothetical protein